MAVDITQLQASLKDLSERIGPNTVARAMEQGISFSRWLEKEDPTHRYPEGSRERNMTALQRQMAFRGIFWEDDPAAGEYASLLRDFAGESADDEGGIALCGEWMVQEYRKVSQANRHQRSILTSDWGAVGSALRPYVEAAARIENMPGPAIPLAEIVALTTPIDDTVYRALYMNDTTADRYRMVRVGEAAEIPGSTITAGSRAIDLYKYGRRLDVSYEVLRRTPLPVVAFFIARLAVQAEVDKVSTVVDVLINGDGNSGTAATVVPLGGSGGLLAGSPTVNVLTLEAWLAFKLLFDNPYTLTTELVQRSVLLQQMLLNTGSANIPLLMISGTGFGGFTPINDLLADNVRYGITTEAPANKILAFDRNQAIERVTEIGSVINETQRWIKNQTETMTFTEVEGYRVLDPRAVRLLDLTDVT
jgi:hypothetical protein